MISENDVQKRFIAEELDIHGEYMVDAFIAAIEKRDLVDKGNLIKSFNYKTSYSANKLSVSFYTYGRIHDLKSKNTTRFESPDANALVWGIKKRKPRKKSRKKQWYAKTAYGSLGRLTNTLMYGLSDIERKRITNMLRNENKVTIQI